MTHTPRTAGLPPRSSLPRRTTRYNAALTGTHNDTNYMLLRRWIDTYELTIRDGKYGVSLSVELAPIAALRLARNLTAALRVNGHWKD